jgi:cell division protein FtsI/penicillin-binding protein 2
MSRPVSRRPRGPRRTRILALAALLVVVAAAAVVLLVHRGSGTAAAARALDRFAATWSAGHDAAAGAQTDAPAAASRALAANRSGLDGARIVVRRTALRAKGDVATGRLAVRWAVPGIGTWSASDPVRLDRGADDRWVVHYAPQLIDAHLTARTRLGTDRSAPRRAPILDRDGNALVGERPVAEVGLARDQVSDPGASAAALAAIVDVDAAPLAQRLRHAGPHEFVEAVTLRRSDYEPLAARLRDVPGIDVITRRAPLTPSHDFARALLGAVGPATAEQVQGAHGRLAAGDDTGQWGLEQQFDARLSGTPGRRIVLRDRSTGDVVRTLRRLPGTAPEPVRTRLSERTQQAAEQALGSSSAPSALVVVQPSTGDVLAVADRPTDSTFDRALGGAYAPGSTFKIVTTAALLRTGLSPATPVACPPTISVDGRSFHNFEGEASSAPSFADDFAISCNTAFISLARRLAPGALARAGSDYGLGRELHLGVGVARSHVPPGKDPVARAATMIGQDRITATPLAMAGVAATVADGRWRAPRLLAKDPAQAGPVLAGSEVATLRSLMRGVVTHGTGNALAGVPGGVAGKTGTAEYGSGSPPPTHAWFVAFRGDLALAVLVEDGVSGGAVAAPIAARFFAAYGG